MAYTQHRPHGAIAGRRFGAFSGKTADTGGSHPVSRITQHRPEAAIAGRRFGSFSGKAGAPASDPVAIVDTGISHAWKLDPGWAAIWGPTQYGIPQANRDNVVFAATGAVLYLRPRLSAGVVASRITGGILYARPRMEVSAADASIRTTGAVLYARPRAIAGTTVSLKSTGAVVYVAARMLSGLWSSTTVGQELDLANLRSLLPRQDQTLVDSQGKMTAPWYRFIDYWVNTVLGGPDAPSMSDVIAEIERQIVASQALEAATNLVAQQAQANAEALAATVQVVQTAALSGSDQIPPVRTTALEP